MNNINFYDIKTWVNQAQSIENKEFREAVHTILSAISFDSELKANMILKGGILLGFHYKSSRYTKDIDFSTSKKLGKEINVDKIKEKLNTSLAQMVETLDYDLDCRVQSSKIQPKRPDPTFPSIKLKIGYAYKGTPKHKKLLLLSSPTCISIDYSLNEETPNIEKIILNDKEEIFAYSLTDLIAEKYRSLLQQEIRKRMRRQDVFDLSFLIEKIDDINDEDKILKCLISKSHARNIYPDIDSFDNPELRRRAEAEYPSLKTEIEDVLPEFSIIFERVSNFYKSLPWDTL